MTLLLLLRGSPVPDSGVTATVEGTGVVTALTGLRPVAYRFADVTGHGTVSATVTPVGRERSTSICTRDGDPIRDIPEARHGNITRTLGGHDDWQLDATGLVDELLDPLVEVKLRRGTRVITWGPVTRPQVGEDTAASGHGATWHLTGRHIPVPETAILLEGRFEEHLGAWSKGYNRFLADRGYPGGQDHPPGWALTTDPTNRRRRVLKVQNDTPGADAWVGRSVYVTGHPTEGTEVTFTGEAWVASNEYEGPAYEGGRGLYLERFSATKFDPRPAIRAFYGTRARRSEGRLFIPIDDDTPQDRWVPMAVTLTVPAGVTEHINARLYAPHGVVLWRNVALTAPGVIVYEGDKAEIAAELVAAGQAVQDLGIEVTGRAGATDRLVLDGGARHNVAQRLTSLVDEDTDWSTIYTETRRIIRVHGRGGLRRPAARLTPSNCHRPTWAFDGEQAASDVTAQGDLHGHRAEGRAQTLSAFSGGLIREVVITGQDPVTAADLTRQARRRLALVQDPETITISTFPDSPLVDTVDLDCVVTLDWAPWWGDWRVTRWVLRPDDGLDLTLEKWTP